MEKDVLEPKSRGESRAQVEGGQRTPLKKLDLDWTESEWFQVWLKLARNNGEISEN